MNNLILNEINLFKEYAYGFMKHNDDEYDSNIQFKIDHSIKVLSYTIEILNSENILSDSIMIYNALVSALYHDIGRFEQYQKYNTFSDTISEDHGHLGVKVLKDTKQFNYLYEIKYVRRTVLSHNKKELPDDNCLICKLVRDADKLDILHKLTRAYETNSISETLSLHLIDESNNYSEELLSNLLNNLFIDYHKMKYKNDMLLAMLSWFYQLNFSVSKDILFNNQIDKRLISLLPDNIKPSLRNFISHV